MSKAQRILLGAFPQPVVDFLLEQKIGVEEVFDGRGKTTAEWKSLAQQVSATVVVTSSPCKAAGHLVRTRAGHCAQCDTSKIAYTRRYRANGHVYVAFSNRAQLVKVGSTTDLLSRPGTLRAERYGGEKDWVILFSGNCSEATQKEMQIHNALVRYKIAVSDSRGQVSRELFTCPPQVAITVARHVLSENGCEHV